MPNKGNSSGTHTALYRKYRSRSLDEIVSQSQVTGILRRSLEQGKVSHAYLLTGPKGVGKTSIARIMAHEINGLPYSDDTNLDIIEIDAASNNSVEDVRDLRDKVQLAPVKARKKIYIIDEVHMLSKSAFNALLKTLEEPPAHVVFILATTDLHKVPATIISRTQHFALRSISQADLAAQLKKIAEGEGITITDDALDAIAAHGDGSFRNSISLLDQLSSFADDKDGITLEMIQDILGLAPHDAVDSLLTAVDSHDVAAIISQLDTLESRGIQPTVLTNQLITAVRGRLAEHPQSVVLLDALLGVSGSPQPQLKLLTVLVAAGKPKSAPAAAARATKPRPTVIEAPVIVVEKEAVHAADTTPKEATPKKSAPTAVVVASGSFDWAKALEYARENLIPLYSVLKSCDYTLEGDVFTLYCGRKFNKTKLDEAKYQAQLYEALASGGYGGENLITVPEQKPLADENLAKVAAVMGGGHEVTLEDD